MKRTVTILGGDERMAWLAESLRREGYIIRLAALLPPAPLKNRLPQPETPDRLLPESETVILAVPTVGPDGMLRTPTVPECYPLAECLRRLPEGAMVLGGRQTVEKSRRSGIWPTPTCWRCRSCRS